MLGALYQLVDDPIPPLRDFAEYLRIGSRDAEDRVEVQRLVKEMGLVLAQTYWWRRSHRMAADPHSGGR